MPEAPRTFAWVDGAGFEEAVAMARGAQRHGADALVLTGLGPAHLDPIDLASALVSQTEDIMLVPVGTTTSAPWDLARRIASLDHLSDGRAGWAIAEPPTPRVIEFVDVVRRVWDGWEEDALVADRATGVWADVTRLHPPRFHGAHFDVEGVLPFPRAPQGHPLVVSLSGPAPYADVVVPEAAHA